jgi:DNA-binding LytR/AlgR family response regulator
MNNLIIKCIAVDDEPLALEKMKNFIAKVDYLQLEQVFENPLNAVSYLKENEIDLIFLDIQMEDLTGIQLMQTLKKCPKVIFTTAYDQYALKGYELDVLDYLLKPISFDRFLKATEKAYAIFNQSINIQNKISGKNVNLECEYIFVKTENRHQKILLKDILYVQGLKDYLMIYTPVGRVLTLQNFQSLLNVLPDSEFVRVHKSFVVALNKIDNIERNRIKIGEKIIPIGETYKKPFYEVIEKMKI